MQPWFPKAAFGILYGKICVYSGGLLIVERRDFSATEWVIWRDSGVSRFPGLRFLKPAIEYNLEFRATKQWQI